MDDQQYESCLKEVPTGLKTKGFNFTLKIEQESALRYPEFEHMMMKYFLRIPDILANACV